MNTKAYNFGYVVGTIFTFTAAIFLLVFTVFAAMHTATAIIGPPICRAYTITK